MIARVRSRGSASGIAPCSMPRARNVAHANSTSRMLPSARWRASSSRGDVRVLGDDALELLPVGLDGLGLDLVEGVQLGLEVVIQRRRADADGRGDVGQLRVLVALASEVLRRDPEDVRSLAATRGPLRTAVRSRRLLRSLGLGHGQLFPVEVMTTVPAEDDDGALFALAGASRHLPHRT